MSFRQEVVRKAMVAFKTGEKFKLASHARMREAIEQYHVSKSGAMFSGWSPRLRVPMTMLARRSPSVQQRLVSEYGYDDHSAKEALSYVTTCWRRIVPA